MLGDGSARRNLFRILLHFRDSAQKASEPKSQIQIRPTPLFFSQFSVISRNFPFPKSTFKHRAPPPIHGKRRAAEMLRSPSFFSIRKYGFFLYAAPARSFRRGVLAFLGARDYSISSTQTLRNLTGFWWFCSLIETGSSFSARARYAEPLAVFSRSSTSLWISFRYGTP